MLIIVNNLQSLLELKPSANPYFPALCALLTQIYKNKYAGSTKFLSTMYYCHCQCQVPTFQYYPTQKCLPISWKSLLKYISQHTLSLNSFLAIYPDSTPLEMAQIFIMATFCHSDWNWWSRVFIIHSFSLPFNF